MITCLNCGQEWPVDPALLVPCPTCHAKIGQRCKRPSGHGVWGGDIHPDRDRAAMRTVPGYGRCPAVTQAKPVPALPVLVQAQLFRSEDA
ncbi:hypothetical protein SE17_00100 [Kouleothrix aurantiaca]|uniref:DNA-binding phage zinc finger domain-containing protein n=1 Tax=Kouleothrix aurantiaca TaxID=186479 RepID=A0A0P9FNW8_9CHLR|nr:hypothetical protein SE17_00100 [Kouleothrix aurantiaca]